MNTIIRKIGMPGLFLAGMLCGTALTGTALAQQTHMLAAQGDLQSALGALQAAIPDKAGHRVIAINLVNRAINQTNMGIAAGAR